MPTRFLATLALAFLCSSCVTTNEANLQEYLQTSRMRVSQDEAPEGSRPLEVISYYKSGFYLFGVIPLAPVELDDAVEWLTSTAEQLGADGIAHLSFQYSPASFWKFTIFPIPDWTSWIHVSGMAYELPDQDADESPASTAAIHGGSPSPAANHAPTGDH